MATLTVRNLDETVRDALRKRAAEKGCSMEAEVRDILRQAVNMSPRPVADVLKEIHQSFREAGGVDDLEIPERTAVRPAVIFD